MLGNGTLDDNQRRYDENESDEIYDETLIDNPNGLYNLFPLNSWMIALLNDEMGLEHRTLFDNTHDHYNLEMTSISNQMPYQCYWICIDRSPGDDETDIRIPFKGGQTFDEMTLEDESDISSNDDVTLIGNPYDPYNLEMMIWMISWISPLSDEL